MFKVVFRCPALNERVFWYVSTESMGEKMVHDHLHKRRSVRHARFEGMKRNVDFFVDVKRCFTGNGEGGVGVDNLWG